MKLGDNLPRSRCQVHLGFFSCKLESTSGSRVSRAGLGTRCFIVAVRHDDGWIGEYYVACGLWGWWICSFNIQVCYGSWVAGSGLKMSGCVGIPVERLPRGSRPTYQEKCDDMHAQEHSETSKTSTVRFIKRYVSTKLGQRMDIKSIRKSRQK